MVDEVCLKLSIQADESKSILSDDGSNKMDEKKTEEHILEVDKNIVSQTQESNNNLINQLKTETISTPEMKNPELNEKSKKKRNCISRSLRYFRRKIARVFA